MGLEDEARSLFLRDNPEKADLAIVFGSSEPELCAFRARHAANLYRLGLVPALVLSGGKVTSSVSEADQMAAICVDAGVPREHLWLENESRTTFENAAKAVNLLARDARLYGIETILLVSCPWHMRRAYLTTRQAFTDRVRLLCCPHDEWCTEASWRESAECILRVTAEIRLIERFTAAGLFRS
jgi:uncharacterized SAM-binding protein YcdF (DUF218 family)